MAQFLNFLDAVGDVVAYLVVVTLAIGSFAVCAWAVVAFAKEIAWHRRQP